MGALLGGVVRGYADASAKAEEQKQNKKLRDAQVKLYEAQLEQQQRQQAAVQKLTAQRQVPINPQSGMVAAPMLNAGQPAPKPKGIAEMLAEADLGTLLDAGVPLEQVARIQKMAQPQAQKPERPFVVGGNLVDAQGNVIFQAPQKPGKEEKLDPFRGISLPQGMMFKNPNNPGDGIMPIPGFTPPSQTQADEDAAKKAQRDQGNLGKIDSVLDEITKAEGLNNFWSTGNTGALLSFIRGTDSYTLDKRIKTIKANIGFDQLQRMREASPTGGALGQVAVQELEGLQNAVTALDPGMGEKELADAFAKVRGHYLAWRKTIDPSTSDPSAPAERETPASIRALYQSGQISKEEARQRIKNING